MFIFFNTGFSQSGIKWSFGGNDPTLTDYLGTYTSTPLIFKTDNIERVRIVETGYVGIGTSAPLYKLQVIGTAGISEELFLGSNLVLNGNTSEITSGSGTLGFGNTNLSTTGKFSAGSVTSSGSGSFKDVFVQNKLSVGSSLKIDGNVPEITSGSGSLSFGNSNLNTTGTISAGGLNVQGLTEFAKITVQDKANIGNLIYFFNPNPAINSNSNLFIQSGTSGGNTILNLMSGYTGIGTDNPHTKLDVNGDACVRGYLYVTNGVIIGKKIDSKSVYSDTLEVSKEIRTKEITSKTMYSDSLNAIKVSVENIEASKEAKIGAELILDGLNSQIYSNSGLIDFRNTNLKTTGFITASRIETDVFHSDTISFSEINSTGNIITTGDIYARNIFAEKSVNIGNFEFKNGGSDSLPGTKDTIKTQYPIVIKSKANSIRLASDTVIMKDRLAIGKELAEYSLDVAGDARFQDMLIVEDGLIIGKDYRGETGEIDSLRSKDAIIDTVRTEKLKAVEINASDRIDIGSGNTIRIDGTGSKITSTTGLIDFGSTGLKTTGTLNVGAITANDLFVANTFSTQRIVTSRITSPDSIIAFGDSTILFKHNLNRIYADQTQSIKGIGIGFAATATGVNSTAIGRGKVNGDYSVVIGNYLEIPAGITNSIVIGSGNNTPNPLINNNSNSLMIGFNSNLPTLVVTEASGLNTTGNVGIGTDDPQDKLDVAGNIRINDNDIHLRVSSWNSNHGLGWYGSNVVTGSAKIFADTDVDGPVLYGYNGGALGSKYTDNTQTKIEKIAIRWTQDGDVGIGTDNPQKKLHIVEISDDGSVEPPIEKGGSIRLEHIYTGGTNSVWDIEPIANSAPGQEPKFNIGLSNSPKLTLTASGRIGIGTTSPTEMLDIFNLHNNVWMKLRNSAGNVTIGFNGAHGSINSASQDAGVDADLYLNWYSGNDVVIGGGGVGTDPSGNILWDLPETGNLYAKYNAFLATDGGKVYIGINEEKNDPLYMLYVEGGIKARDVKVTSLPFPDYVFKTDYKLRGINELKEYINLYGHLPGIPSAKEIEQNNGFELGKMDLLLLEKIEEQALYIIKLQEQIDELKKNIKK